MYSKGAISTSRRVCQFRRQTSWAFIPLGFRVLKAALDRPGWTPNSGGLGLFTPEPVSAREVAG
ncbi:hypothetical protein ACFOHK_00365 [Falsigemmobacter intermedius]|uniref:hypothetical protein n=1 Tax=Falsigemmobacter intermedius TaxID=1553448 RepID=UPI0013E2D1FD|nr:hypothetical protein [Falsigemmobacter intermedius]